MPCSGLQCVIVVFPDYTHLLFGLYAFKQMCKHETHTVTSFEQIVLLIQEGAAAQLLARDTVLSSILILNLHCLKMS